MSDVVSHYRILRKIGSGGMGDVFLAEDSNLHRQVALKMLRPEAETDPQRLKRFMREAYAASSLSHPNIAAIYEAGQTKAKAHFIAMEYVAGESLDQKLSRGPLPTDDIVELAVEIGDALDEAHSKGIIHRDLKPSNVMLSSRGHAKVLDFGLAMMTRIPSADATSASSTEVKSAPGQVLGTIPYTSPEQLLGRAVDHRSDIFSFGVLLYEMATGRRPFLGRSSTELAEQICHEQPEAIARLNYEIPDELDRIIRKCMEKDPGSRYQSAREVAVDLKNFRRDRSTESRLDAPSSRRRRLILRIAAAVVLLAAGVAAWLVLHARTTRGTAFPVDSLAVLPFANSHPEDDYLSDGITTSIIDSLSQLPQLKVMSRSSVFRFKGRNIDPQEIGRQLKVQAIVTGRIATVDDRLAVAAELIDVSDGRQLWGQQYTRPRSDVFVIQGEVSSDISEKLRIKITGEQRQRLTKRHTSNAEAYVLYLKGRYHSGKRTAPELQRAIELFQGAIEKDPTYALAYVGLADCYGLFPDIAGKPLEPWHARAKAAVQKALQIDDTVAEAHATLGYLEQSDWNRDAAEREYRRAIELNPNYATAHQWYSLNLCTSHRLDEGLAQIQKAQQLDPLSPIINYLVGFEQWARGNDDEAIREYRATMDLDPGFGWAYTFLGGVYALRGDCAAALKPLQKGVELTDRSPQALGFLGYGLARCGDRNGALSLESELDRRGASQVAAALVSAGRGDMDAAFQRLERAYQERDAQLLNVSWEPQYGSIRSDPRYFDLARRVGMPH